MDRKRMDASTPGPALAALFALILALPGCGKGDPDPAPRPAAPETVKTGNGEHPGKPGPPAETPAGPAASGLAQLPEPLQKAIGRAAAEKKLVVVDVYDATCNFCQDMDEVVEEQAVQKALADFVYVKIGIKTEAERRIIEQFSLVQTPTFLFYKVDGTALEDILEGFRSAPVFLAELRNMQVLASGKGEEVEVPEDEHPSYGMG